MTARSLSTISLAFGPGDRLLCDRVHIADNDIRAQVQFVCVVQAGIGGAEFILRVRRGRFAQQQESNSQGYQPREIFCQRL